MTVVRDMVPVKCRYDQVGAGFLAHQVTCGAHTALGTTNGGSSCSLTFLESISAEVLCIIIFCLKSSSALLAQGLRKV